MGPCCSPSSSPRPRRWLPPGPARPRSRPSPRRSRAWSPPSSRWSCPTSVVRCASGVRAWATAASRTSRRRPTSRRCRCSGCTRPSRRCRRASPGPVRSRPDATRSTALFGSATAPEQAWLRAVVTGNVRQGALDAVTQEAVAQVAGVPSQPYAVPRCSPAARSQPPGRRSRARRSWPRSALRWGGRSCRCSPPAPPTSPRRWPASPPTATTEVAIDAKLDGIRIQAHRDGDDVIVVTRSLDDITGRLPEVVEVARSLPAERFVLDGEALALSDDGRPMAFQDTASRTAAGHRRRRHAALLRPAPRGRPRPARLPRPRAPRRARRARPRAASRAPPRHLRPRRGRRLRHRDRRRGPRGRRRSRTCQRRTPPAAADPRG